MSPKQTRYPFAGSINPLQYYCTNSYWHGKVSNLRTQSERATLSATVSNTGSALIWVHSHFCFAYLRGHRTKKSIFTFHSRTCQGKQFWHGFIAYIRTPPAQAPPLSRLLQTANANTSLTRDERRVFLHRYGRMAYRWLLACDSAFIRSFSTCACVLVV